MTESGFMRFAYAAFTAGAIERAANEYTRIDPHWSVAIGLAFGVLAWLRYRVFSMDYQVSKTTQGRG